MKLPTYSDSSCPPVLDSIWIKRQLKPLDQLVQLSLSHTEFIDIECR